MQLTAQDRYYTVYKDGEKQSNHTTEREAIQELYKLFENFPDADLYFDHDYKVWVEPELEPILAADDPAPKPKIEFQIYNGSVHEVAILPDIGAAYAGSVYGKPVKSMSAEEMSELPSLESIDRCIVEKKSDSDFFFWDIEHFDPAADDPAEAEANIDRMIEIQRRFKASDPNLLFGCYDMVPRYLSSDSPKEHVKAAWQATNDRMRRLADEMDFLAPNRYVHWTNPEAWVRNLHFQNEEARRIAPDKPLFNFLWPQWPAKVYGRTDGQPESMSWIDADYWALILQEVSKSADGAIIYILAKQDLESIQQAPWWEVTQDFMA